MPLITSTEPRCASYSDLIFHNADGEGAAADAATYNNVHPTDLGHWKIAEFYINYLPPLLAGKAPAPVHRHRSPPPSAPLVSDPEQRDRPAATTAPMTFTNFTALEICGRAFNDTPGPFNRLPAAAERTVRPAVWALGLNSAGLSVRFQSNAPSIAVQYQLASASGVGMVHFPASGVSGADLYALDESASPAVWKYVGTRQNMQPGTAQSGTLATGLPTDRLTSYRLYLPTYNTVLGGAIGVPGGSKIGPDTRAAFKKPAVVWYGTGSNR